MKAQRRNKAPAPRGGPKGPARARIRRGALACVVAAVLCPAVATAHGPITAGNSDWDGLSEFASLAQDQLGHDRVQFTATLNYSSLTPADALILVHPEEPLQISSLTQFLAAGGRIAVLDDFGTSAPLLEHFGIRRHDAPADPKNYLDNNPQLAVARPSAVLSGGQSVRHASAALADDVVTNHPAALTHPELTSVLEIPTRDSAATLAVTGIIANKGRLMAVSDSSLFINWMLRYPGNRAFAVGLLDYVGAREPGAPVGRIYVLSGSFDQRGTFGRATLSGWEDEVRKWGRELMRALSRLGADDFKLLAGLLVVGVLLLLERRGPGAKSQISLPGYCQLPQLALEPGLHGRVYMLSAMTTPRTLTVLELADALEQRMRAANPPAGSPLRAAAEALLSAFRPYQDAVSRRAAVSPSARDLKRLHEETMSVLSQLQAHEATPTTSARGER